MAAGSKVARYKVVTYGDIGNISVNAVRQALMLRYGQEIWDDVGLWIVVKKLKFAVRNRLSSIVWEDYITVMGKKKFMNTMMAKFRNMSWKKHWKAMLVDNRNRLRQKSYSLNMMVEWIIPAKEDFLPDLEPEEMVKLRELQEQRQPTEPSTE